MPKDFDREGDGDSATAGGQGAVSLGVIPEGVAALIGRGRGKLDHFKKTTLARLDEEEEHESYAVAAAWERFGEFLVKRDAGVPHLPVVLQTSDALAGYVTAVVDDRLAQFLRTFIEVFGFRINPDADQ